MNRQILYLRPDPARVVVRPFKPATEPRDINPTDKTRANHIVGRVLQLDAAAAAQQLSDVVENLRYFVTRAEFREGSAAVHWTIAISISYATRRRGHNRTRQQLT